MSERSQIDEIKSRLNIADVVLKYVPSLKHTGRNHFGLCPFHKEKTPSFSVNSEIGIYKCFGCGESGDVIKFLEKIEGLEFYDALKMAAEMAGVELRHENSPEIEKANKEKARVLEANKYANEYFAYLLQKHDSGEFARNYLKKRKITRETASKFSLGYAPSGYHNLEMFMIKKGFSTVELLKFGLLAERNGKTFDKFRNRLMFPIFDLSGNVIGFSGRTLEPKNENIPKYLNSPETSVYHKSRILFGLYHSRDGIRHEGAAIIVEGNVDILSAHQAGATNIVAPLGTALTAEQLNLLGRYCHKVYMAFDTDLAGEKALLRALDLLEAANMETWALELGKYQDLDEYIRDGQDINKLLVEAQEVIPYLIKRLSAKVNFSNGSELSNYVRRIMGFVTKIKDPIRHDHYIRLLSSTTGLGEDTIRKVDIAPTNHPREVEIAENSMLEKRRYTREEYFLATLYNYRNQIDSKLFDKLKNASESTRFLEEWEIILNEKPMSESAQHVLLLPTEKIENTSEMTKYILHQLPAIRKDQLKRQLALVRVDKTLGDAEKQTRITELTLQMAKLKKPV